jgi:hypothetical protein
LSILVFTFGRAFVFEKFFAIAKIKTAPSIRGRFYFMERVRGVEPLSSAWKAGVIPIYDTRQSDFRIAIFDLRIINTNLMIAKFF